MPATRDLVYKDLSISFLTHPVNKKITVLSNNRAVEQAVKLAVMTNKFERPYNPNFGGNILSKLFENFDSMTEHMIKKDISDAIRNYEPRADLLDVVVNGDEEGHRITITVYFRVINQREPVEARIIVERVR